MQTVAESKAKRMSGYLALFLEFVLLASNAWLIYYMAVNEEPVYLWGEIPLFIVSVVFLFGFFVVQPNEARALVLFGRYIGSAREDGFWWA
ncbi:MAG TPA: SPFH domain-containing protein, partial [Bacteroidota bacterium]|nr:SPFH domain-containing protein [Bacteroidota bacterium]